MLHRSLTYLINTICQLWQNKEEEVALVLSSSMIDFFFATSLESPSLVWINDLKWITTVLLTSVYVIIYNKCLWRLNYVTFCGQNCLFWILQCSPCIYEYVFHRNNFIMCFTECYYFDLKKEKYCTLDNYSTCEYQTYRP